MNNSGITRRERMEKRLQKRIDWAESRKDKAAQRFADADRIAEAIPLGQPILVGHHSERHARSDQKRIQNGMAAGIENLNMAKHHENKAAGIEDALKRSIFSDDPDAIENLQAKADELDARRAQMKACNAAIRKHAKTGPDAQVAALVTLGLSAVAAAKLLQPDFCGRIGFPSYVLTNNSSNARRCRERIKEVQRQTEQQAQAEEAGGVLISGTGDYVSIRFSEKPEYAIIQALKAAGFHWSGGQWNGYRARIPEGISS